MSAWQFVSAASTMLVKHQAIAGGSMSRTITRCWQLLLFPLLSVTVHVTRLVPTE